MIELPWYYLGDIVSVLYLDAATSRSTDCHGVLGTQLVREADEAVPPRPQSDREHPVAQLTRRVVSKAEQDGKRKPGYPWDEDVAVPIRVRSGMQTSEAESEGYRFLIGPSGILLSWPFAAIPPGQATKYGVQSYDGEFNPETDTDGDLLLFAGDEILKDETRYERLAKGEDPRAILIEWVHTVKGDPDYSLPDTIQVRSEKMRTDESYVEFEGSRVSLVLGVSDLRTGEKNLVVDEKMYKKWPCGAFGDERKTTGDETAGDS